MTDLLPDHLPCGGAMGYGGALTEEMRAEIDAMRITTKADQLALARRLEELWREKGGADRARFNLKQVVTSLIWKDNVDALVTLGVLGVVRYDSGAWQYAFTPYTRPWFFAVQALAEKAAT